MKHKAIIFLFKNVLNWTLNNLVCMERRGDVVLWKNLCDFTILFTYVITCGPHWCVGNKINKNKTNIYIYIYPIYTDMLVLDNNSINIALFSV